MAGSKNAELEKAFLELAEIQAEIKRYELRHASVVNRYLELKAIAKAKEEACRSVAQRIKQGGTFKGGSVIVTVPKERVVDSRKLLKIVPATAKWPGLFRVVLQTYDAARLTLITDDVNKSVLTEMEGTPRTTFRFS